ncbi:acyltransferase family protein [Kutzneria sp. NPDC051319]|uniref:acyltransferase family protein n=1 Tax=Kutzneria sp. NPDC051319 TaxID=3155047 RepID=UPI003436BBEB
MHCRQNTDRSEGEAIPTCLPEAVVRAGQAAGAAVRQGIPGRADWRWRRRDLPAAAAGVHLYNVNLALGLVVFVAFLTIQRRMRPVRWIGWLADRSYSLYLLHGLLAVVVMNALSPTIGHPVAVVAGLVVTILGLEIGYRLVERPSMRLARRIARRC